MLGGSNKETRSCIQWVKCHCPSGVRIRLIDSDNPRTYRRVTPGPRDWSGASLVLAGLAWCWITPLGYPLLMRACLMCLVSWSLAVTVEQTAAALLWSVLTTASLWARGWWDAKSRYRSMWVAFLYTVVEMEPSGSR